MDQCEDREEGVPPSKSTLCGEHESQTKAQRKERGTKRKHEPGPSCVSLRSDWSEERYIEFKSQPVSAAERINGRPAGPEPESSCVSLKSDWSEERYIEFKVQPVSAAESRALISSDSPSTPPGSKTSSPTSFNQSDPTPTSPLTVAEHCMSTGLALSPLLYALYNL